MENGEWRVGSWELGVGSWELGIENGEWRIENREQGEAGAMAVCSLAACNPPSRAKGAGGMVARPESLTESPETTPRDDRGSTADQHQYVFEQLRSTGVSPV